MWNVLKDIAFIIRDIFDRRPVPKTLEEAWENHGRRYEQSAKHHRNVADILEHLDRQRRGQREDA